MIRIYITKWVLHRGILVAEVEKPAPYHYSLRDYAFSTLPDHRFRAPLRMGSEAFLTLEEAKEDAQIRFEKYHRQVEQELAYVKRSLASMKDGKYPKVHTKFKKVADCKAYD